MKATKIGVAILAISFLHTSAVLGAADSTAVNPVKKTHRETVKRDTFVDRDKDGVNDLRSRRRNSLFIKIIKEHKQKPKKKKKS